MLFETLISNKKKSNLIFWWKFSFCIKVFNSQQSQINKFYHAMVNINVYKYDWKTIENKNKKPTSSKKWDS